jgi:signal transduction histidine kinase
VTNSVGTVRLLRIAAILLLVYLGLSAVVDYFLKPPGPVGRFLYFYVTGGSIALAVVLFTFWGWAQKKLGGAFLPITVIFISGLPILANQIVFRYLFSGAPPPDAMIARVAPFLLIGLLLVAWQFPWQHVLSFNLAVAFINIAIVFVYGSRTAASISSAMFAVLSQVFAFVVVGLFTSIIVTLLRRERRSLEEANERLTNYSKTLEDLSVSRERTRIAQELHDTLSHTLSGLSVQLEAMKAYWDVDPETARKRLDRSLVAARSGLDETRRALAALRAKPLEELGLKRAIEQLAEEAGKTGLELSVAIDDNLPNLCPPIEQCLYRTAQEAIANAVKHAHASRLAVALHRSGESAAILTVQDNGVGFDTGAWTGQEHFGLVGMRERAELAGGKLDIISSHESGTVVRLTVQDIEHN